MEEILYNLKNILSDMKYEKGPRVQWVIYDLENIIGDVESIIRDRKDDREI